MTDSLLMQEAASTPTWWAAPWRVGTVHDPDMGWVDGRSPDILIIEGPGWWEASSTGEQDLSALLEPIEQDLAQVRSRARVRDLAEVFTHQREVDAMLDQMPDAFTALDVRFLEPACGSGNFLTEVLRRKLRLVSREECVSQEQYEHRLLRAISSIYGVDISPENIIEARGRMAHVLLERYQADVDALKPTAGFLNAAMLVLGANVVVGDTLNAADKIELCEWRPHGGAAFQRVWSYALTPQADRDLFWDERVQDAQPVHYSALKAAPEPARVRKKAAAR
jgi:hypothetical protein